MSLRNQSSQIFVFNVNFFALTIILILVELTIASTFSDGFIRPLLGDFFVAVLCYSFIRSFLNFPTRQVAIWVLLFTYFIEISQAFSLIQHLGLAKIRAAQLILGTSFDWLDLIAYTIGIMAIYFLDPYVCKVYKTK